MKGWDYQNISLFPFKILTGLAKSRRHALPMYHEIFPRPPSIFVDIKGKFYEKS
jgi:hypothetical protein